MQYSTRASFARPADTTAYAAGDLIANSTTAASVVPLKFNVGSSRGRGRILRVKMFTDSETVTLATYNLWLFTRDPGVPTNGDNGALAIASVRYLLGIHAMDLASGAAASATDKMHGFVITGGWGFDLNIEGLADLSTGQFTLYGLLEADAAYVPASGEVFEVTLDIESLQS